MRTRGGKDNYVGGGERRRRREGYSFVKGGRAENLSVGRGHKGWGGGGGDGSIS